MQGKPSSQSFHADGRKAVRHLARREGATDVRIVRRREIEREERSSSKQLSYWSHRSRWDEPHHHHGGSSSEKTSRDAEEEEEEGEEEEAEKEEEEKEEKEEGMLLPLGSIATDRSQYLSGVSIQTFEAE